MLDEKGCLGFWAGSPDGNEHEKVNIRCLQLLWSAVKLKKEGYV